MRNGSGGDIDELRQRYLDLVKRTLMRQDFDPTPSEVRVRSWKRHIVAPLQSFLATKGVQLTSVGSAVMPAGETMIGSKRLDSLQACVETALHEGVPGDLIEAGVWRGGATILMRAVLAAYDVTDRIVWAADSFEGFPLVGDRAHQIDRETDPTAGMGEELFRVGLAEVKRNFARYGLLDGQVRFLVGWFSETLASAPIEHLAVIRLDSDLYGSTWDALCALYPRLSVGGYVIVDDYGMYDVCRRAVDDFRASEEIVSPIEWIDDEGVFWRRVEDVICRGKERDRRV